MSDEAKEPVKPAAAPAPAKPEAPPPEPGPVGILLQNSGVPVRHLGKDATGTEMIGFHPADAIRGCELLRDNPDCRFDLLVYCAGVDLRTKEAASLESVYLIFSTEKHTSIIVKILAELHDDEYYSPSLMPVWPAADWHERETYDLFGIHYKGHPGLKRILMPEDWMGYPLRKDYKVDDPRLVWNQR